MGLKSWVVHYKNKYRGGNVMHSGDSLDVFDKNGDHAVALRKDGHGSLVDMSGEMGCVDCHDLAPIPKQARVFKVLPSGKIGKDDEGDDRDGFMQSSAAAGLLASNGKVKSIDEVGKKYFNADGSYEAPASAPAAGKA